MLIRKTVGLVLVFTMIGYFAFEISENGTFLGVTGFPRIILAVLSAIGWIEIYKYGIKLLQDHDDK